MGVRRQQDPTQEKELKGRRAGQEGARRSALPRTSRTGEAETRCQCGRRRKAGNELDPLKLQREKAEINRKRGEGPRPPPPVGC